MCCDWESTNFITTVLILPSRCPYFHTLTLKIKMFQGTCRKISQGWTDVATKTELTEFNAFFLLSIASFQINTHLAFHIV